MKRKKCSELGVFCWVGMKNECSYGMDGTVGWGGDLALGLVILRSVPWPFLPLPSSSSPSPPSVRPRGFSSSGRRPFGQWTGWRGLIALTQREEMSGTEGESEDERTGEREAERVRDRGKVESERRRIAK